jgi:hypothetical protein
VSPLPADLSPTQSHQAPIQHTPVEESEDEDTDGNERVNIYKAANFNPFNRKVLQSRGNEITGFLLSKFNPKLTKTYRQWNKAKWEASIGVIWAKFADSWGWKEKGVDRLLQLMCRDKVKNLHKERAKLEKGAAAGQSNPRVPIHSKAASQPKTPKQKTLLRQPNRNFRPAATVTAAAGIPPVAVPPAAVPPAAVPPAAVPPVAVPPPAVPPVAVTPTVIPATAGTPSTAILATAGTPSTAIPATAGTPPAAVPPVADPPANILPIAVEATAEIPPAAVPPTVIPATAGTPPAAVPPAAVPPAAVPSAAVPPVAVPPVAVPPVAVPPVAAPPVAVPPVAISATAARDHDPMPAVMESSPVC